MCLQTKVVSLAYFLSFGIFVPLASYMIVYALHLLRIYQFENVAVESGAARLFRVPVSDLYEKVRSKTNAKLSSKLTLTASSASTKIKGRQTDAINSERRGQAGILRQRTSTTSPVKQRGRQVLPTTHLPSVSKRQATSNDGRSENAAVTPDTTRPS